jgi:hypothetical protein
VVHGVEVVPEKKKAEDPVRFNDRSTLVRLLAPAMLGKASHHPEDETRIGESREIEPQLHVEYQGHRQEDETRRDHVPKPDAQVASVAEDDSAPLIPVKLGHLEERANEEPPEERLVDDEDRATESVVTLPVLLVMIE